MSTHAAAAATTATTATPATLPALPPRLPLMTAHPWELVGISRATWYRLMAAGETPAPVSLGKGAMARWRVADVEKWVAKMRPARGVRGNRRPGPGRGHTGPMQAQPADATASEQAPRDMQPGDQVQAEDNAA